ncbi:hypothetical protein [Paraburkholderia sp. J41]|uniref:hypothetical protein n=1 Tax=Paraburkholderia sp. J41 TaxID=2805433 RepID=UPI002AC34998|nr:hypothetical protein [Paraburkholderia sp. J41]
MWSLRIEGRINRAGRTQAATRGRAGQFVSPRLYEMVCRGGAIIVPAFLFVNSKIYRHWLILATYAAAIRLAMARRRSANMDPFLARETRE